MKKSVLGSLFVAAAYASLAADVALPNTSTIADIQAAIDAASAGDVITLADGTYVFDAPLTIEKGITLTGSSRDNCILSGENAADFETSTALTISHVDACVSNLTVANVTSKEWYNYHGTGVRINAGKLTHARVTGCKTAAGNRAAGVSIESSDGGNNVAYMSHCLIDHNEATGGNGVGGVLFQQNSGTIDNCLIWANTGKIAGGVYVVPGPWKPVKIVNCTVVGNTALTQGGGISFKVDYYSATAPTSYGPWVVNTIIANNTAPNGADLYFENNADNGKAYTGYNCLCPTVSYGANPQTSDPLFVNAAEGDFHLQPASRARNGGDATKAASVLGLEDLSGMLDFYGLDRVLEDNVDIGCSEFMVDPNEPTCVIAKDKDTLVTGDTVTLTAVVDGFNDVQDIVYSWSVLRAGSAAPESMSGARVVLESLDFGSYTVNLRASSEELGKSIVALPLTFVVLPKTLYVTASDNPSSAMPYGTPETAANRLAEALEVAVEGATIVLDEGTHNVSETVVVSKGVKIVGAGRDKTTIYADKAFNTVVRINGQDALVQGVTIAHGRMSESFKMTGSGVVIGSDGGTLADCRVTDCGGMAWKIFGAVNLSGSNALVTRCLIDGNEITTTQSTCGGIYATAGRIENCVIANNVGASAININGTHKGSGLCLNGSVVALNCTVVGNRMLADAGDRSVGAGVHLESDSARVHNCIIDGNLNGDETENDYLGKASSFTYCLSSSAAPEGSTGCVVGSPIFHSTKPYYLVHRSPGQSQGSVVGYEDRLMEATDFYGQKRVKNIDRHNVADIDIGATESNFLRKGLTVILR